METEFPFVGVPRKDWKVLGVPDEGTRIYRREGSDDGVGAWFDRLFEMYGPLVSPGGVSMYVSVSRAGVHKRMRQGRLTAFCYHVVSSSRSVFGFQRKLKERPYVYIPVSECKAWAKELESRPERQETEDPRDRDDRFLARDPKDAKNRRVKYVG